MSTITFEEMLAVLKHEATYPNLEERLADAKPTSELENDLRIDSLDREEMRICLEDAFKIDIPCDRLSDCVTATDLLNLINRQKGVFA